MMFANLALLTPSLRGSLNPTLTLWFPLRSTKAGDTPNADTNSPVDLLGSFVSFPITELKLDFILSNTIAPPASRTLGTISSVLLPNLEIFRSEEHTSELQSRGQLVCRLLREK